MAKQTCCILGKVINPSPFGIKWLDVIQSKISIGNRPNTTTTNPGNCLISKMSIDGCILRKKKVENKIMITTTVHKIFFRVGNKKNKIFK